MNAAALFVGLALAADPKPKDDPPTAEVTAEAPASDPVTDPIVPAAVPPATAAEAAEDLNARLGEVLERLRAVQAAELAAIEQDGTPVKAASSTD